MDHPWRQSVGPSRDRSGIWYRTTSYLYFSAFGWVLRRASRNRSGFGTSRLIGHSELPFDDTF
jgi:hypothetical protein